MEYSGKWDKLSVGVSLVCAIHCVVLPVFFSTLTLFEIELMENPVIEFSTIVLSVGAGGWAVWKGYRKFHRRFSIVLVFLIGLLLMTLGNAIENELSEQIVKFFGVVIIITAHYLNWRKSNHCELCKPDES